MRDFRPDYRPDIDGLRAIAVLGVIAFHAAPSWLPGGFIGVDVFFVISGFLISTIILREIDDGSFSLASFYARRIRRILPALTIVLGATAILGWYYLLPHEFAALGKHLLAGSAFFANFALKREAGYFDAAADEKPLLHLWSLGIEEQFYVLWPLLLMAARNRRLLLVLVSIIVAISFLSCVDASQRNQSSAFFLPQFRVWELGAGTVLAILTLHGWTGQRLHPILACAMSSAGIALLVAAATLLDDSRIYPGHLALWPVLGTSLVIAAGHSNPLNSNVLSLPLLVGIGLISFPLYLWHWPLLSFAHILKVDGDWRVVASIVCATFLLALATYIYIERPIRRARRHIVAPIVVAAACVGLVGAGVRHALIEPRLNGDQFAELSAAAEDWTYPSGLARDRSTPNFKFYRSGTGPGTVIFFGDSHAQQYWPRIQKLASAGGAPAVLFATRGGCPPILGLDYKAKPDCEGLVEHTMALAAGADVSAVVFSAVWFNYFTSPSFEMRGHGQLSPGSPAWNEALHQLTSQMRRLVSSGKRVYLVLGSPLGLAPEAMLRRTITGAAEVRPPALTTAEVADRWGPIRDALRAAGLSGGAQVIDPIDWLCTPTQCSGADADGRPMYKDATHLRASYVREHASFIDATMGFATGSVR